VVFNSQEWHLDFLRLVVLHLNSQLHRTQEADVLGLDRGVCGAVVEAGCGEYGAHIVIDLESARECEVCLVRLALGGIRSVFGDVVVFDGHVDEHVLSGILELEFLELCFNF